MGVPLCCIGGKEHQSAITSGIWALTPGAYILEPGANRVGSQGKPFMSRSRAKAGDPGLEGLSQASTSSLPGSDSFAFYFSSAENSSPNPTPDGFRTRS